MPGVGVPGLKGEKVNITSAAFSMISVMQIKFPNSLHLPRANVVCASLLRLGADLPASKCQREQEAIQANRALQVLPDLQDSELMANR